MNLVFWIPNDEHMCEGECLVGVGADASRHRPLLGYVRGEVLGSRSVINLVSFMGASWL